MKLPKHYFDILVYLERHPEQSTQRKMAEQLDKALGTVNKAMAELLAQGLVADGRITEQGLAALEPYRVRRAVILAAGFGSRLVPITLNTPKPLVRVHGGRIIDTLLDAMLLAGIDEIHIVRGYLGEQFDQLKSKYPNLHFYDNPLYADTNNISSMMCVRDLVPGAYVCDADLLIHNPEIITKYQYSSNYLGVPVEKTDDWCLLSSGGYIKKMVLGGVNCHYMFGVSYWTPADGERLSQDVRWVFEETPGGKQRFWDQVALEFCAKSYQIAVRECKQEDIVEIDTYRELKAIDPTYGEA